MDKERVTSFMKLLRIDMPSNQNREGWVIAHCPLAPWTHGTGHDNDPSFGIKIEKNKPSHYYCFSCGEHGDLDDLVLDMKAHRSLISKNAQLGEAVQLIAGELDDIRIEDTEEESRDRTLAFAEDWLASFPKAIRFDRAKDYLKTRGLTEQEIEEYDLRFDAFRDTVCFQIREGGGTLVGLHGRIIEPWNPNYKYHAYKFMNHWNKLPWLGEDSATPDDLVVLVESVFDWTQVKAVYPNVIAALSSGLSKSKIQRIALCKDVITFFDRGTGGDAARASLDKHLTGSAMIHLVPPEGFSDPGEMPRELIREVFDVNTSISLKREHYAQER